MKVLPLYINSEKIRVLLVGGGNIACRKLKLLIDAGADVTVIAKVLTPQCQALVSEYAITYYERAYEAGEASEYSLVIAATNSLAVNALVEQDANQLVCRVDDAKLGNVLLPATVRRGDLVLTVSTGGASPSLTKKISQELAEQYDIQYADYVDFLSFVRKEHRGNKRILQAVIDSRFVTMPANKRMHELHNLLKLSD
ncbi:MAG: hypothetical protein KBT36_03520 [Kurthia sp.]|nr:hypothetical protein [Candidatus Kurthia equi]